MRKFVLLMVLMITLLVSLVAQAADPAQAAHQQTWWQSFLSTLLDSFLVIAVPVIAAFVTALLRRWGIKVQQEQVEKLAEQAASFAEQKARVALREGKPKTSGAEKMSMALDVGKKLAKQYKLSDKAIEGLEALIEAKIAPTPTSGAKSAEKGAEEAS